MERKSSVIIVWSRGNPIDIMIGVFIPTMATIGGLMFFSTGFGRLKTEARIMPFRVYEKGITKIFVPSYKEGLSRKESLIPFIRIKSVEVSRYYMVSYLDDIKMEIIHVDDDGKEHTLTLLAEDIDEPLAVMLALRTFVPEALGKSLDPYVGPGSETTAVDLDKNAEAPVETSALFESSPVLLMVSCGLLMAITLSLGLFEYTLYLAGCHLAYATFIIWVRLPISKRVYLARIVSKIIVTEEGLVLPYRRSVPTLFRRRELLRFHEISEVQRILDPKYYGHMARVTTVRGEEIITTNDVFDILREHPNFNDQGYLLVNERIAPIGSGTPLVQASAVKAILFLLLTPLPWIAFAFYLSYPQDDLLALFKEWFPYYIVVLVVATSASYLLERLFMPAVSKH